VFIRRKVNRSGSTSIHIFKKEGQRQIHVKSIGNSSDSEGIKILERQARSELARLQHQQGLDLQYDQDKKFIDTLFIAVYGHNKLLTKVSTQ